MCSGNRYELTCINLLTSYVIAVPIPNKAAELVVEAYLSGIISRTGASMVCLSGNGSELKNSQINTILTQLGIKKSSQTHTGHKVTPTLKMYIISSKEHYLSFYLVQMQNGIRSYHLPTTVLTQPLQLTTWKVHFSSFMVEIC